MKPPLELEPHSQQPKLTGRARALDILADLLVTLVIAGAFVGLMFFGLHKLTN